MQKFLTWMEQHFVPVAAKIGSQKHLVAVRDAFISIMPITMAGAFATLLNVFIRDLPTQWGMTDFVNAVQPIIAVNGNVWWGTIAMLSIAFVFALGYQVAKAYKAPELAGGLVAIGSFLAVTPQAISLTAESGEAVGGWGFLAYGYLDARGLFTALIIGLLSGIVYSILMNKKITIKLPDSVPPAVSKAFASIIPGVVAIYLCGALAVIVSTITGSSIADLITTYIQLPFLALSQGLVAVLILVLGVQLLWFFGIHGTNVLGPVLDGVYLAALNTNNSLFMSGTPVNELPYFWTRGSFDAYVWMGGAGCTLAFVIAILIFSKRKDEKTIAKLSAPMGIFNINEPVIFGIPVVLNPLYFIPWMLVPFVLTLIAYGVCATGLITPVYNTIPWIMPPGIYAFLATGGDLLAAALALFNLAIATAIWGFFVLLANKFEIKDVE
ncbi:MAG: PTS sugar transporter subunit IIC [Erysipelotrichaceae bacterium]